MRNALSAVRQLTDYTELPIHPALAPRVVCTWVDPARSPRHPVLPDACMDIVWDGTELAVVGPDTGPVAITSDATFIGVRFRPGAAPGFLGSPAHELRDRHIPLADLWGGAADELAERLAATRAPREATALLERALLARLPDAPPVDPLVAGVFRELAREDRQIPAINAIARDLAADERTLRRRCVAGVGYGPKTLERILRFRRALRLGRAGIPLAIVARAAGYADQAHLSRECQRLAGTTPGALFAGTRTVLSTIA